MQGKILLWFKVILTLLGAVFLSAISATDPANLIRFTGRAGPDYDDGAKAASFALIAAMAIAIQRISTGESREDKWVDRLSWALTASAAFLAAWFWLKDETGSNPLPYLEEILIVGGVIVLTVVIPMVAGAGISWLNERRRERRGSD